MGIGAAIVSALAMFLVGMAVEHWLKLPTTFFRDLLCPFMAGCAGAMLVRQTAFRPAILLTLLLSAMTISSLAFVLADQPMKDRAYILGCFFLFNTSPLVGVAIVNWLRGAESFGSQVK